MLVASIYDDEVAWVENVSECVLLGLDADGLRDSEELLIYGTDASNANSDGDGHHRWDEVWTWPHPDSLRP